MEGVNMPINIVAFVEILLVLSLFIYLAIKIYWIFKVFRVLHLDMGEVLKHKDSPEDLDGYIRERKKHQEELLRWAIIRSYQKRLHSGDEAVREEATSILEILNHRSSYIHLIAERESVEIIKVDEEITERELAGTSEDDDIRIVEVSTVRERKVSEFPRDLRSRIRSMLFIQRLLGSRWLPT
jgi:hypothetical protein